MRFTLVQFGMLLAIGLPVPAQDAPPGSAPSSADIEYFEKTVRPILADRCYSCHSADAKTVHGGLRVDTASELFAGGDSGPVIARGRPESSLLIEAIRYAADAGVQMPPKGKLPPREIDVLTEWVRRGAPFPSAHGEMVRVNQSIDYMAARGFWSFREASPQPLPQTKHTGWPIRRIDHFVLAAMEREGLQPAPAADRRVLLRRLSFDLIGLPPTPGEVDAFLADTNPDAWEKQVERLLESPHFGERWARVWLDLARYTDKTASWLNSTGHAHLYRDWVVQAMNDDMPYDQFVHRQLATDLMSETGPEDMPALGFLGLSPNYWKELKLPTDIIKVIVADEWEERVDAVSRTFLGLTVACARCHDHKFDPVSTEDYYALAGVFASSRLIERPVIDEQLFEPVRRARALAEKLKKQIAELRKKKPEPTEQIAGLTGQLQQLQQTPHFDVATVPAVAEESLYVERQGKTAQDGSKLVFTPRPRDLRLFIRGNPNRLGDVVPRRFLQVLSPDRRPFQNGSGRLELARAITEDAASLTARVIVNRIWLAHFGRGLVTTPSNFGRSGEQPSHPQLLDDLAARFIQGGWSVKDLHREMVLSAAYRQSSQVTDKRKHDVDPENRWLARRNPRRLPVEAWRDAMLFVTGELDLTVGGPSAPVSSAKNVRRTLYATVHRREMSTMLLNHDFPDPTAHSPQRVPTVTTLQGLYALNGPLLLERSAALARRLQREAPDQVQQQIRLAYRILFSRAPTAAEMKIGLEFFESAAKPENALTRYAHVLLASNEFLFVD